MYQIKEEDARKALDSLRQVKRYVEEGIMILERLVMQGSVWDVELYGEDPDDYLSEWVTWEDDDYSVEYEDFADDELYETDAFLSEKSTFYKDQIRKYCDCTFCEECDSDEL